MPERIKIRCIQEVTSIFAEYRPEFGRVYDAVKGITKRKSKKFVIVDIRDKRIVLRDGEYEIVGV